MATKEHWSITVRPTPVGRMALLPLYALAPPIGGTLLFLIVFPVVVAVRGSFSGEFPAWVRALLLIGWIVLSLPGLLLIHRINRFALDRAHLRLTSTTLYLGRAEQPVPLDRVSAAYFATQHGIGKRKFRSAGRDEFNVLLLVLDDGSLVPLSPPPGKFIGLMPDGNYFTTANVAPFLWTIVSKLEGELREGEPLPPDALAYLHPMDSNRLHHPSRPPRTGFVWTLARWTWL